MRFFKTVEDEVGFTLLEVLLAMALFAIVVSVVYVSYSATFRTAHNLEARIAVAAKARIVMDRLLEDLESIYLGHEGFIKGEREDLQFTSTAHLIFSKDQTPAGRTTIGYRVVKGENNLLKLYRSDNPYRPTDRNEIVEENKNYLLCDGLKSVQFTYISREDEEMEDWDSEEDNDVSDSGSKKVPKMVQATLTFADDMEGQNVQVFKTAVSLPLINASWQR